MRRHAFLLGNSLYHDARHFPKLPYAERQAFHLYSLLTNPPTGFFCRETSLCRTNIELPALHDALQNFFAPIASHDFVLLYFSGYADLVDERDIRMTMHDSSQKTPAATSFHLSELVPYFLKKKIARSVIILDCCYPASSKRHLLHSFSGNTVSQLAPLIGQGKLLLNAVNTYQNASNEPSFRQSFFSRHFLQEIRNGNGQNNFSRFLLMSDVCAALQNRIQTEQPEEKREFIILGDENIDNMFIASNCQYQEQRGTGGIFELLLHGVSDPLTLEEDELLAIPERSDPTRKLHGFPWSMGILPSEVQKSASPPTHDFAQTAKTATDSQSSERALTFTETLRPERREMPSVFPERKPLVTTVPKPPTPPLTLTHREKLEQLVDAILDGTQPTWYHGARGRLYQRRMLQSHEADALSKLETVTVNLDILAKFFKLPWGKPAQELSEDRQNLLLSWTSAGLRAEGRFREAIMPLHVHLKRDVKREAWQAAARDARELSHVLLLLGKIRQAIMYARQGVKFAEQTHDWREQIIQYTTLGNALRQTVPSPRQPSEDSPSPAQNRESLSSGEAEKHIKEIDFFFQKALQIYREHFEEHIAFPSQASFYYCNMLISREDAQAALKHATEALRAAQQNNSPIDTALAQLSLSQARLLRHQNSGASFASFEAQELFNQAIESVQAVGDHNLIVHGFLNRAEMFRLLNDFSAATRDLKHAEKIAGQTNMQLHLTEYHLQTLRLLYDELHIEGHKRRQKANIRQGLHFHLEAAEALIWKTGYRRRDVELTQFMAMLKETLPKQAVSILKPTKQPERADDYEKVFLSPGHIYISKNPTVVWTVLGSCVSVILHSKKHRISAICHAQLPEELSHKPTCHGTCPQSCFQNNQNSERFKYVNCSIRYMFHQLLQRGIPKKDITVKLFGGSNMLIARSRAKTIGEQNLHIAHQLFREYGFQIEKESIGGTKGRTLYVYTDTGEVLIRHHRVQESLA